MPDSEKDRAANDVAGQRAIFGLALSDKRKYPVQEFRAFVQATRRYIEITQDHPLIHRSVASAVNGLREYLAVERKRVQGMFCLGRTGWNVSCSLATILPSRATNLRDFERPPVVSHLVLETRDSRMHDFGGWGGGELYDVETRLHWRG
jgi:hypothetical protein